MLRIPQIGFGTWRLRNEECRIAVQYALKCGYPLIDTASIYKNEEIIGDVIEEVPRESYFITSKASPYENESADSVYNACCRSLSKLRINYLDLYLLHWPGTTKLQPNDPQLRKIRSDAWKGMQKLLADGKVKHIGVSNYTVEHLKHLKEDTDGIQPELNQVEFHPLYQQRELREYCEQNSIVIQGYSTIGGGTGDLLNSKLIQELGQKYGVFPASILLNWSIRHNVFVLPRSKNINRIKTNFHEVNTFTLLDNEMESIDHLELEMGAKKFCWDPSDHV